MDGKLVIFKYPIYSFTVPTTIDLPKGAEILSVQSQNDIVQLWALVSPVAPIRQRTIILVETGQFFKYTVKHKYINTFQMFEERTVYHAFEITN